MKHLSLCVLLIALGWMRPALAADAPPAAPAPTHTATHASPPQANFLKYVDEGQYSGTIFHRVIQSFIVQGGGFDANYKEKPAARKTVNESGNGLPNVRGTVGLARPSEPHAGDCQFYVNLADNNALDPNPARWGYAVFGKVIQGMDVLDRIGSQPTGARAQFKEDAPLDPIKIERIERVTKP